MKNDPCDAPGFSELERRNRARLEAFNEYSRAQSSAGNGATKFEDDDSEHALANAEEALAVEVEERERPLDEQTWRTLQRIVDEPPARPALPIAHDSEVEGESSVTVGDVISTSDWAEIRALYSVELRKTPFA